ncbi:hypothetical protein ABIB54_002666 [Frigoribacterium sp. UYMn621]
MTMNEIRTSQDPVVVYDVMREAANRLVGVYAQRATVGGTDDPAIQSISAIYDEVEAIDPNDLAAQEAATGDFRARYAALRES